MIGDMSGRERAQRRGAITQREFLADIYACGFVELTDPGTRELHAFKHDKTGDRRFVMPFYEQYSAALPRLVEELRKAIGEAQ